MSPNVMFGLSLSGLQDFVYDVDDEYAARRLRIRSVLLNLVPALVGLRLRQCDSAAEIHYLGGGKLLAQASERTCRDLVSELQDIYAWLVNASAGRLGMHWNFVPGNGGTAADIQRLLGALAQAKWRAGRTDAWFGHTGVREVDASSGLGDERWESDAGARLARDVEIQGFRLCRDGWRIGSHFIEPVKVGPEIGISGRMSARVDVAVPLYAPRDSDGAVAKLSTLAEEAGGAPYLAVLKLDGDRIGALLGESLAADLSGTTFRDASRKLTRFFGQEVPSLLEHEFDRVYLVYSGGDDLVATGHFDTVIRAAIAIQKRYVDLKIGSVSAGISFYTRNSPILKAVESADRALTDAKATRNTVSIGGCRLSWQDLGQAVLEIDELVDAINGEQINRGALQTLRQLGASWMRDAPPDAVALRWRSIPQLHYIRSRRDWREREWGTNIEGFFNQLCKGNQSWQRASLVGTLASWLTKSGQEER